LAAFGTLVFTIAVPGTWTVVIPYLVLTYDFRMATIQFGPLRFIGVIPILLGVLIYLWCAWDFTFAGRGTPAPVAPPKELVVKGLYRYVRNPMYVGIILILSGESVLFQSVGLLLYAGLTFVIFHTWVVIYEEPTLRDKFPDSYTHYCDTVSRWIPKLRPKDLAP